MACKVLVNDAVKRFLVGVPAQERQRVRKAFEFLENGLWEGGLRVKKLKGLSGKVVLEGRLNRGDRILFTLGSQSGSAIRDLLIYVWALVPHDHVEAKARAVFPEAAPFLSFTEYETQTVEDVDIEMLDPSHHTQEGIEERMTTETGSQRWFLLDDREWERILLYSKDEFEIFLYLTKEQKALLEKRPPLLLSGTAGSGKTTLGVYYLLLPFLAGKRKLFVTYSRHLRNHAERLYRGLCNSIAAGEKAIPPEFLTFKELCLRLVPKGDTRFRSDREIDAFSFLPVYRRHKFAEKYDSALVWEEIRSIIKGAKPQVDATALRRLLKTLESGTAGDDIVRQLREELLGISRLSVYEKADDAFVRVLHSSLNATVQSLEKMLQEQHDPLLRALRTVVHHMEKHEADFSSPLMTLAEYEHLGRKRAPLFPHSRPEIYSIAQWYQSQLAEQGLWDEIDLTRAAIRAMDEEPGRHACDFLCSDEVQDFTDIQLSLLVRLPKNPESVVLAGDPKQIVNPSGFRWEEAKRLFYERGLAVPEIHSLTLNFRSVGNIVLLANALLQLKQELLGVRSDEKLDDWKFQGHPPYLIEKVPAEEILRHLRETGADRMILTRTEVEREFLKETLGTELVFTIREAKGLEFRTVLLWRFCSDRKTGDLWSRMLSPDAAATHEAHVRHEINLLYVAITRAQRSILIYDGPESSVIWNSNRIGDLVFRTQTAAVLEESWSTVSTAEEWKTKGDYFFENHHYRAAAECYRNANAVNDMHRASAHAQEQRRDFRSAAFHWEQIGEFEQAAEAYEKGSDPARAMSVWEILGNTERIFSCRVALLEEKKLYAELADLWEQAGRFDKAKENWHKAGRHDRLAPIYEKEKKYLDAAKSYEAFLDLRKAASLYLKAKRMEDAARCYESAGMYGEAIAIWKKRKKNDEWLRCLKKWNRPELLAQYHESHREWGAALQCYQRALNPELRTWLEKELESTPRRITDHAKRAVRLTLFNRAAEAAAAWESAKEFERAAVSYRSLHDFDSAGRCFAKIKRWKDALSVYAQSEQEFTKDFAGLRKSLWRCLSGDASGRSYVTAVAESARRDKKFHNAFFLFKQTRHFERAGDCAIAAGLQQEAVACWENAQDYAKIRDHFQNAKLYEEGARILARAFERRQNSLLNVAENLETLLDVWLTNVPESREKIAEIVESNQNAFKIEFLFRSLEPAGYYDSLKAAMVFRMGRMSDEEIRITGHGLMSEANRKLEMGDRVGAGFRFMMTGGAEKAKELWNEVAPTVRNMHCVEEAGCWEKVVALHEERKDPFYAALVASRHDTRRATALFLTSGQPLLGGEVLEKRGDYEAAFRLYQAAGAKLRAARTLEKLKRFAEAAEIYKSIGSHRKYVSCLKKVRIEPQKPQETA